MALRVLFITPHLPYPPRSGSALIAYRHIQLLAERHSVDLISFRNRGQSDVERLATWCRRITLLDQPPRWQVLIKMAIGVAADWPLMVSHYASARMAALIRRQMIQNAYDVVIFQLIEMAQFRPARYSQATILSMEDPLVLKYERVQAGASSRPVPLWKRYERARLQRYERGHVRGFDRVLLLNQADARDYQARLPDVRFDWAPYGVDVEAYSPSDAVARRDNMIVMTGNMNHPPNVEAVGYFCREVLPLVRALVPAAILWLVGANPVDAVSQWSADPQIKVTGAVADIRPYLRQARVSVCPVQLKIGTQTKILEALACGTPVVTTTAGNNGIGAVAGEHLLVADTPAEFAASVVALLTGNGWETLSENGRRFVVEHFAWEKSGAKLEQILSHIIREKNDDHPKHMPSL